MYYLFSILLVFFATVSIFISGHFSKYCNIKLHSDRGVAYQLCYQIFLVGIALIVLGLLYLFYPKSLEHFWHVGNIDHTVKPVSWLGITSDDGWLQISLVITFITIFFVWWQGRVRGIQWTHLWYYLPWVFLFSFTNAFSEEVIYRLGVIVPLFENTENDIIMFISAIAFGLVHYRGMPNGILGIIMAGVLGWLLAKSVLETTGLFWAFGIHFVQDIIVISSLLIFGDREER